MIVHTKFIGYDEMGIGLDHFILPMNRDFILTYSTNFNEFKLAYMYNTLGIRNKHKLDTHIEEYADKFFKEIGVLDSAGELTLNAKSNLSVKSLTGLYLYMFYVLDTNYRLSIETERSESKIINNKLYIEFPELGLKKKNCVHVANILTMLTLIGCEVVVLTRNEHILEVINEHLSEMMFSRYREWVNECLHSL